MSPMKHMSLGPSAAEKWFNCPGALQAEEAFRVMYPEQVRDGSAAAELGTKVHDLCEQLLLNKRYDTDEWWADCETKDLPDRTEGITNALGFKEYVMRLYEKGDLLLLEKWVKMPQIHKDSAGTSDVVLYKHKTKTLHIIDYKNGVGYVEIEKNKQLFMYGLGGYNLIADMGFEIEKIECHIYQPRIDNIGGYEYNVKDFFEIVQSFHDAAAATRDPDAPRIPGEKQCQWCIAKTACVERGEHFNQQVMKLVDSLEDLPDTTELIEKAKAEMSEKKPTLFTLEALEHQFLLFDEVEAWIKDVKAHLKLAAARGETEHVKMVEGRGSNVCVDPDGVELTVGDAAYHPPAPRKLKSMTDLKKIVGAKNWDNTLDGYFEKRRGKPILVPSTDKRKAMDVVGDLVDSLDD